MRTNSGTSKPSVAVEKRASSSGGVLALADIAAAARAELEDLSADGDRRLLEVDLGLAQAEGLAAPQASAGEVEQLAERARRHPEAAAEAKDWGRPATGPYQLVGGGPADAEDRRRGQQIHHNRQLGQSANDR